ncbi:MAG: hypothetical protein ABI644_03260 [Arenimonas sp.]
MNTASSYQNAGAVLLQGLFSTELTAAYANFIGRRVVANASSALAPPSVGNKLCYEVSGAQWPALMTVLWGLTPKIEAATGVELLPTYCYFRTYQQGDICRIHADRPACEHSLSLTLAYADGIPWSLAVADSKVSEEQRYTQRGDEDFGREQYQEFPMAPGDAVLYRGTDYRHGRLTPNPNRWSAHIFMHWVDRNGPYRDQAFDGQVMSGPQVDYKFPK